MADKSTLGQHDGGRPSSPRIVGLLPESTGSSNAEDEIAQLRQEQRLLRDRQDELDRALRNRKEERDDDDSKEKGDEEGDGKEEDKPKLGQRIREGIRKRPARAAVIALGVLAALIGGLLFYLHTLTYEDTDDAQVDADISAVSPRIGGTVTAVRVVDNQTVHAGDLLAELDPRDFDTALAKAQAALAQAEAQLKVDEPNVPITNVTNQTSISTATEDVATAVAELASAQRSLGQSEAQVAQAEANDRYARVESERSSRLASVGAVAPSEVDQRTSAADATSAGVTAQRQAALAAQKHVDEQRAKLASARQRLEEAQKNAPRQLEARQATVAQREAAVAVARAEVDQAELNRSYTRILAPVDGIVGSKSVNVGDRVQPGQQLAGITQTANMWVTANFRETQLRRMHPGQRVTVHVDALGLDFRGGVESLPGATGSRYSLLPPENATGNYVKVVQRLPVRIRLERGQKGYELLRPGMSVEPTVTLQ